jgi:DNA-nicking Smr family endonuclease
MDARDDSLPPEPQLKTAPSHEEREEAEVMQALRDLVEGEAPLAIHQTDEAIEGAVDGLDGRIMDKLRRGEFSVQDHLDLHGSTRDEARQKVESFLLAAIAQGKRCVLIIHGRGHGSKDRIPVLKNALKSWLQRRALSKKILAFSTAQPFDGGAGAVYVLLRTRSS